jgi:hypothetical protein
MRLVEGNRFSANVDGNEWNAKEISVLVYILRNLCSSKFSLSSFLDMARESFRFAQTGYQNVLREFEVVEDTAVDLYRNKVVPFIKKVSRPEVEIYVAILQDF